eukprot:tig00000788_g4062.t1
MRDIVRALEAALGGPLWRVEGTATRRIAVGGASLVAQIFPLQRDGLDWLYVFLVEESDSKTSGRRNKQTVVLMTASVCSLAVVLAVSIRLLVVVPLRSLSRRIENLRFLRRRFASGETATDEEEEEDASAAAEETEHEGGATPGPGASPGASPGARAGAPRGASFASSSSAASRISRESNPVPVEVDEESPPPRPGPAPASGARIAADAIRMARRGRQPSGEARRPGSPRPRPGAAPRLIRLGSEFRDIEDAFRAMAAGVRSFEKYVPGDCMDALMRSRVLAKPGLSHHSCAVLFADIQDFSALTETMGPERLVEVVGEAMEVLSQRITEARGTVDKYLGDAVMAFFSTPLQPLEQRELHACAAALACQRALAELRPGWRARGLPALEVRIGSTAPRPPRAAGRVLIGNFGSTSRLNYTVLGDRVNIAARLEPLNKRYGTSILVSGDVATLPEVRDRFLTRLVDKARPAPPRPAPLPVIGAAH